MLSEYHRSVVEEAFAVHLELFTSGMLDSVASPELYRSYRDDPEVGRLVDEVFLAGMNCATVRAEETYYLVPGLEDSPLAMSNAELRTALSVRNNTEMYTAMFVILCIISILYTDEGSVGKATYVSAKRLEEYVTDRLKRVSEPIDAEQAAEIEDIQEDCEYRLKDISDHWLELPVYDESLEQPLRSWGNRFSFILRVARFLENEGFLRMVEERDLYPTGKLNAVVTQYYPQPKNRDRLLRLVRDLGRNHDAEN